MEIKEELPNHRGVGGEEGGGCSLKLRVKSVYPFKKGGGGHLDKAGVWLYLVLSDDPVGLRRLSPLQDDLLLVGAALNGLQRNSAGNCGKHSEARLSEAAVNF